MSIIKSSEYAYSCNLKVATSKGLSSISTSPRRNVNSSPSSSKILHLQTFLTGSEILIVPLLLPPSDSYTLSMTLLLLLLGSSPRDTSSSSSARLILSRMSDGEPWRVMAFSIDDDAPLDEEYTFIGLLKLKAVRMVRESRAPACGRMA